MSYGSDVFADHVVFFSEFCSVSHGLLQPPFVFVVHKTHEVDGCHSGWRDGRLDVGRKQQVGRCPGDAQRGLSGRFGIRRRAFAQAVGCRLTVRGVSGTFAVGGRGLPVLRS